VPSIIYYEGLLDMTNEVGVVTCADARTGERVWRHRLDVVFSPRRWRVTAKSI
jgi:hypothetical protein